MTFALAYWLLMLALIVFSGITIWPRRDGKLNISVVGIVGAAILLFTLLVLIGWKIAGPLIKG